MKRPKSLQNATVTVATVILLYAVTTVIFVLTFTKEYAPTDEFLLMRLVILLLFVPIIFKYVFHLIVAPWYPIVESMRSKERANHFMPSVSVLIPAWNEEVGISATIRSVLKTKYPNLEVIIVNDGSTDRTHDEVTAYLERYRHKHPESDATILYKRLKNGGKAAALNHGLTLATGEIIVTIDADSVMDAHAIRNLVKHFTDPRVASVAGNVVIGNRRETIGFIQQLEYVYGFYFKRADSLLNAVYIVGGAAAAYRRSVIQALGGFDEKAITEDIELSTRLQDCGYHVRYAADAIVYTEGPSDFMGLCRQRLRWKFGRLYTFRKYRHLFFSTDKKHNFYLSFFILPIALFAELLLFFEGLLLTIFYTYTFYTNDYTPLAFVITLVAFVVCLQVLTDRNIRYHLNLLLLAPVAWLLFYFIDLIEYQALMRSIWRLMIRKKLTWQKWARVGLVIDTPNES